MNKLYLYALKTPNMHFTGKLFNFLFLALITTLVIGCQQNKSTHQLDLDFLFKIKLSDPQQDSIAKNVEHLTQRALTSKNTLKDRELIDSVLDQLRWTDAKEFVTLAHIAKKDAIKSKDQNRLASIYNDLAVYYQDKGLYDSVYYYHLQSENIYKKLQDNYAIAENNFYQGILFYELGLQIESEVKIAKALKLLEKKPNNPVYMLALQTMAYHYTDQNNLDKAEQYLDRAFQVYRRIKDNPKLIAQNRKYLFLGNLYANYSMISYFREDYNKAEIFAQKGIEEIQKNFNPFIFSFVNMDYQLALYKQGKNPNIIEGLMISYKIHDKLDYDFYKADLSIAIAQIYQEENQSENAIKWAKKSYDIAKKANLNLQQKQAIEFLLLQDSSSKNYHLIEELIQLNKVLHQREKQTQEKFTKIEYETLYIVNENKSLRFKITVIITVSIVVFLSLIFLFFYTRTKAKNIALKNLAIKKSIDEKILNLLFLNNKLQQSSINSERNRIANDLHDGVINSIFTLRFNLQQLQSDNQQLQDSLVGELQRLEAKIREISHELANSSAFNKNSFEELITQLVKQQKNPYNTKFTLTIESDVCMESLSVEEKINLYYILNEILDNVNKHSQAINCLVNFYIIDNQLILTVTDDGIGMDKEQSREQTLKHIKDRANIIQAKLNIESNNPVGTKITLEI